jgi:hypothetical protein
MHLPRYPSLHLPLLAPPTANEPLSVFLQVTYTHGCIDHPEDACTGEKHSGSSLSRLSLGSLSTLLVYTPHARKHLLRRECALVQKSLFMFPLSDHRYSSDETRAILVRAYRFTHKRVAKGKKIHYPRLCKIVFYTRVRTGIKKCRCAKKCVN